MMDIVTLDLARITGLLGQHIDPDYEYTGKCECGEYRLPQAHGGGWLLNTARVL